MSLANFSEPFIRRPVGTTLLAIGLLLVGIVAYRFLPVASMPTVDFPTISVTASRPGADPETMAATVAAPLERRLGEIPGVTELTSRSSLGSTRISVQFDLNRRFRPIMMTTLAALFGAIPLAFESGTGSELRNPLGITIIGGLLLSQLLTLYTTPVIYLTMERLKTRFSRPRPLQTELDLSDQPEPSQRPAE